MGKSAFDQYSPSPNRHELHYSHKNVAVAILSTVKQNQNTQSSLLLNNVFLQQDQILRRCIQV